MVSVGLRTSPRHEAELRETDAKLEEARKRLSSMQDELRAEKAKLEATSAADASKVAAVQQLAKDAMDADRRDVQEVSATMRKKVADAAAEAAAAQQRLQASQQELKDAYTELAEAQGRMESMKEAMQSQSAAIAKDEQQLKDESSMRRDLDAAKDKAQKASRCAGVTDRWSSIEPCLPGRSNERRSAWCCIAQGACAEGEVASHARGRCLPSPLPTGVARSRVRDRRLWPPDRGPALGVQRGSEGGTPSVLRAWP